MKLRYPVNYITITNICKSGHTALDFGWSSKYGGKNQDILAVADGLIIDVVNNKDRDISNKTNAGNLIKINHFNNLETRYIHLLKDSILVKVGDNVKKGQVIAKMGNTGYSFGNHLHFDIWFNGKKVNPIDYLFADNNQVISNLSLWNDKINKHDFSKEEISDRNDNVYIVKTGDSLSKIASKFKTTYQQLAKINNISNPNLIKVGQKIIINNVSFVDNVEKYNLTRLLKIGCKGDDVKELQKVLNATIDGIFGAKTLTKVKSFQKSKKIYQDGIVGQNTAHTLGWTYLNK